MSQSDQVESAIFQMKRQLELRASAPKTSESYLRCACRFLTNVGKAPEQITANDVKEYLLDLGRRGRGAVSPGNSRLHLTPRSFKIRIQLTRGMADTFRYFSSRNNEVI